MSYCSEKKEKLSNRQRYTRKMDGCAKLASLQKKKITSDDILVASRQVGLTKESLANAWRTYQESGGNFVDYRVKNQKYIDSEQFGKPKIIASYNTRPITAEEAGDIILDYMKTPEINSRELSNKYKISVSQFYSWIHELEVSGRLLGKRVLEPSKYAKLNIKDVIWFYRNPNTERTSIKNLNVYQKYAYRRVATVLLNYLPTTAKNKKAA